MIHSIRVLPTIGALFLLFITSLAFAQGNSADAPGQLFGLGQPHSVNDLPPGQLKANLEGLSPKARAKALGWLQRFSFPAEDLADLKVDSEGSIFYVETTAPAPSSVGTISLAEVSAGSPAGDPQKVFKLHSRPGSQNVLFLDFDGQRLENTVWNTLMGQSVFEALPFDAEGNDSPKTVANFTQGELNRIAQIWHRIASDFAPFDIDVTTQEPAVFTPTTGHILFTDDIDASGRYMPYYNATGAASPDVFGSSDYANYPVLVYYTNLFTYLKGYPPPVAETASHEFGHQLGLSHDGVVGQPSYYNYQGHGTGLVSWAPIMGTAYQKDVTQWDQGEYPDANNLQDDLAIIAQKLGFIGDDHGNSSSQATALAVEADGTILVSSPELDPDNVLTENKGVIGDRDDVDWFYVDVAGSGTLEITATPSWHSFTLPGQRGENLDIELSLFNSALTLIAIDDPDDNTNATVTAAVNPGRYYLQLDGVGNNTNSDYSDYASTGMYFIEGSVPMDGAPTDTTPPSPAQMSWQSPPAATGTSAISMTAVTATDASGSVQYSFTCVVGGPGCSSSGWQTSSTYTDGGLQANTSYSYNVRARDAAGNMNNASATASATTEAAADTTPPSPAQMAWQSPPAATGTSTISMTAVTATDASGSVEYSFSCVSGGPGCSSSGWQASRTYTDGGLQSNTSYSYNVRARDAAGNMNNASATASATTEAAADTTPPSPAQMSWQSPPAATGTSTISMTAVTATDDSGSVEYSFTCVSGNGCSSSGWQASPAYADDGLQANTSYSYNVRARDAAGNMNNASATASATTQAAADTTPPSPAQMAWQSPPAATGTSAISMTAVTATDASGSVEYSFSCVSGGPGCSSSGWQASPAYTDGGLSANTTYSYSVRARDAAGNMNNASATASATTGNTTPEDTTPPSPAQMAWQSPPHATSISAISMTAVTATDESGSVEYLFACVSGGAGCYSSGWISSPTYTHSGLQTNTSYSYKVRARDASGNMTDYSQIVSATTGTTADTTPPSPAQMSWSSPPTATGTSTISMTAVAATDASGSVEYSFSCVSGGPGCSSSGWQSSRTFTDSGLSANTSYSYTVRARDAAGNMNNTSSTASATTDAAADTTPPSPAQMAWQSPPHATGTSTISMTAVTATDDSGSVEYSFSCVSGGTGCSSSGWQASPTFTDSGLSANTSYSYTVRARDAAGNMNNTSSTASATTDANPPPVDNQSPIAVASYSPKPAQITRGKTVEVTLNGAGSYDPDGSITAWSWKDQTGSVVSTSSGFSDRLREGNYNYTLTVTDNQGATDATTITVSVFAKQGK